jgi:hypothetical protein
VGTLSTSVIGRDGLAIFRYHISVHPRLLNPRVKVALAWDSAVSSSGNTATASKLTVDLDRIVRDSVGSQVGISASWDNSYEVVELDGRAGETYEILIRRWSGADSVWFGVAWTVTGIPLIAVVDLPVLIGSSGFQASSRHGVVANGSWRVIGANTGRGSRRRRTSQPWTSPTRWLWV